MTNKHIFLLYASVLLAFAVGAQKNPSFDNNQLPPSYIPSGKTSYNQYCAACHGEDGRGSGPATPTLKVSVPDLTTLSKHHGGKFPFDYVERVLRFGPGFAAHGSPEMPVWGPIFQYLENHNEAAVRKRIENLCNYLESIQVK